MINKNKYQNRKTEYRGVIYDSALESRVAMVLDSLRNPDHGYARILAITRPATYVLIEKSKKGRAIKYKADFEVYWDSFDSRDFPYRTVIEVKGFKTPVWKLKERLFKEKYPQMELVVITNEIQILELAKEIYEKHNK